ALARAGGKSAAPPSLRRARQGIPRTDAARRPGRTARKDLPDRQGRHAAHLDCTDRTSHGCRPGTRVRHVAWPAVRSAARLEGSSVDRLHGRLLTSRAPRGWPCSPMGIPSSRPARTRVAATYRVFDPLLPRAQAERMLGLCERFGAYGMYSQEASEAEIGQGLFQRHDAVMNFLKTGGRFGRHDSIEALGARTNYFRETYAYGDEVRIDGIEPFLRYEGFVEAARAIHGRPVDEPAIVYANLLVPGQELAVHTDVPEFRGANRKLYPQWLMVVMHHSGLFDGYGMPIRTPPRWL